MNKYLELMHNNKIPINVITLCIGFDLENIPFQSFNNYELLKYLSDNETQKIIKLSLCEPRDHIDLKNKIIKVLSCVEEEEFILEKEKWLYAKLTLLRAEEKNIEKLLYRIAEIYADFEYPESMRHCIHYISSGVDLTGYTIQQAQNRLVNLCDNFLNELKNKLQNVSEF